MKIYTRRKVIAMLNGILWSQNVINKRKRMIYHCTLENMLLYGAETWTIQKKYLNKLNAVEMNF